MRLSTLVQLAPLEDIPWSPRDVARGTLWVAVLFMTMILGMAISYFILFRLRVGFDALQTGVLSATFAAEVTMAWAAWRWSVHKYGCSWASLGLRGFRFGLGLSLTLAVLLGGLLVNVLYVLSITMLGWQFLLPPPLPEVLRGQGVDTAMLAVLAVGVAPFAEEIFFRGFFFGGLQARWGFGRAAAASALIFSLGHLQVGTLLPVFILGLFLAWLRARTGSLWPCIIVHLAYNGLGLLTMA